MTDPAAPDLAIVERLKRRGWNAADGNVVSYDMINPDGSEAAQCIEMLVAALERIAFLRPPGDIDTARYTRALVKQAERIALDALAKVRGR